MGHTDWTHRCCATEFGTATKFVKFIQPGKAGCFKKKTAFMDDRLKKTSSRRHQTTLAAIPTLKDQSANEETSRVFLDASNPTDKARLVQAFQESGVVFEVHVVNGNTSASSELSPPKPDDCIHHNASQAVDGGSAPHVVDAKLENRTVKGSLRKDKKRPGRPSQKAIRDSNHWKAWLMILNECGVFASIKVILKVLVGILVDWIRNGGSP
jgi:hypothetical protein